MGSRPSKYPSPLKFGAMILLNLDQLKTAKRMYPKVKVRTEAESDEHDLHEHNWSSLLSLKDISFLLKQDSRFPAKKYRDLSPPCIARVPKSYVPNIILPTYVVSPSESASEGSDKKSNISDEEDRPNIRASSVPRPRAVLSSPVNDAVIGNRNRVKALRPSVLKNQNGVQSRHTPGKTVRDQAVDDKNSPSLRKPNDTTDTKIDLRVKKGSETCDAKIDVRVKKGSTTTTPRRSFTASKPSCVRI
ncbi:hypothetical protein M5689_006105 [Euphorbia peplus]|nr:hypothetical protein M5689_006105 [Euphorbia peplus]